MYERELFKLGLTDGEARAYTALLELGSTTVGPVVKKSGIAYSKIYEVLQRLLEKGLASYTIKEKTKYFQAIEPARLRDYLEKQKAELHERENLLSEIQPKLQKMAALAPERKESEIFIGFQGLRTAYELLLNKAQKGDVLRFFYVHGEEYHAIAEDFYENLFPLFKKLRIALRGISSLAHKKQQYLKRVPSFIELRFVDFPIPATIDVFKDKVLVSALREKPIAFLIQSSEVAENLQNYFDSIWETATP